MVSEAPSLFPQIEVSAPLPGRSEHGYYRKKNGWIITGNVGTPANKSSYEIQGAIYLNLYGFWRPGSADGQAKPEERDRNGTPWNPAIEPWRRIFQEGGANEFPVDQIVAYGWHRRPPYREVTFPQLQGVAVFDLPCPECDRIFGSLNERETAQMLKTHLTSRTNTSHSYTPTDLRELGKEWNLDFESARTRAREQVVVKEEIPSLETTEIVAPVMIPTDDDPPSERVSSLMSMEPQFCPDCDWQSPPESKRPVFSLFQHRRWRHK